MTQTNRPLENPGRFKADHGGGGEVEGPQGLAGREPGVGEVTGGAPVGALGDLGSLTGAGYGEKSSDRLALRNGYRERDWETQRWAGMVNGTLEHAQVVRAGRSPQL